MSKMRAPNHRFVLGETRLLMDYLAAALPGRRWFTNIQVGPLDVHIPRAGLSDAAIKLMGKFRRYADAIVPLDDRLLLIETTINQGHSKIGQVMEYRKLVPQTPELAQYAALPLESRLVSGVPDPAVQELCLETGIVFVHFEPAWLDDFIAYRGQRFRTQGKAGSGQPQIVMP